MTKTSWDIHQCPLAKRCRARWEKLEPVQGDTARPSPHEEPTTAAFMTCWTISSPASPST